MENKQTAVEWLWRWIMENPFGSFEDGIKAYNKAKKMEKEQICNACIKLINVYRNSDEITNSDLLYAEQYYNETYEK